MQKKILIISRHAPYGTSTARDALDTALAASVYDQQVRMLFMDDGVFQLLDNQQPLGISQKNMSSMLSALPIYGTEEIYVHTGSLQQRNLTRDDLAIDFAHSLSDSEVAILINQQDHILSF